MQVQYARLAKRILVAVFERGEAGELLELVQLVAQDEEAELFFDSTYGPRRIVTLRSRLEQVIQSFESRTMATPLEQDESNPSFFIFRFADDDALTPEERNLRARYRLHFSFLALLQELDATLFEHLCARVLELVGCESVFVTRSSKDEGVDCFGRLPAAPPPTPSALKMSPFARVLAQVNSLLFGQAKRYAADHRIDVGVVRAMPGTWENIKNGLINGTVTPDLRAGLEYVGYEASDSVVRMVLTTSSFTAGAVKTARTLGIVGLDGDQIAQLLLEAGGGVQQIDVGDWRADEVTLAAYCV